MRFAGESFNRKSVMFCIHCGKELSEEANFCSGCGKAVAKTEEAIVEPLSADEVPQASESSVPENLPEAVARAENVEITEAPEASRVFVSVEDLSPDDVRKNKIFAWAIAVVPLTVDVIVGLGGACLILNIILCYVDENNLKNQRLNMSDFGWETCIIPVYLHKRAKLLRDGPAYTIVWCVLFALSILCVA